MQMRKFKVAAENAATQTVKEPLLCNSTTEILFLNSVGNYDKKKKNLLAVPQKRSTGFHHNNEVRGL